MILRDRRKLLKFCAARKPGNSRIGSREPGREGVCWLAGCGEQDAGKWGAGKWELGEGGWEFGYTNFMRNRSQRKNVKSGFSIPKNR